VKAWAAQKSILTAIDDRAGSGPQRTHGAVDRIPQIGNWGLVPQVEQRTSIYDANVV
jgi:hypothetical protein